jgi:hypothetical protein
MMAFIIPKTSFWDIPAGLVHTVPEQYVRNDKRTPEEANRKLGAFSFADGSVKVIVPWLRDYGPTTFHLPGLQVLTLNRHRPHYPVTSWGRNGIKAFTKGQKTSAGSMVFVTGTRGPFDEILEAIQVWQTGTSLRSAFTSVEDIPEINISVVLMNDDGDVASIFLKGVQFMDSSMAIDVNNPPLPEGHSFIAREVTNLYAVI